MIHGDLFSGIGGFALAARWMGWRTAWFSEVDAFACATLAHHWPDVPNLGDVRAVRWEDAHDVDVLTGGFPCQPHSLAGKRAGSNDERDLFDEIIRCAGVLRPRTIVLENVPGLLTSDGGQFFGRVLGSLAAIGYDARWRCLAAADIGAPHKRDRVWIVAAAKQQRPQRRDVAGSVQGVGTSRHEFAGSGGDVGNADRGRCEQYHASEWAGRESCAGHVPVVNADQQRRGERELPPVAANARRGELGSAPMGWADGVPVRGHDGTVRLIPHEAAQGGPQSALWPVADGIPGRVARLRGIGNAIVPAVALEIFREVASTLTQERAA